MDQLMEDVDGTIQSIHVKNFFCHENLEINLNPNVNFIVGRNGSGKSAILTALVVGLGGRASATNRGSNLHSFIRKGANSASVEIKIKNTSPKAFKHDVYGDFITIVRNITASGGSSYKVKSSSGEVISTKYEEVHSIILAHDIQVDNPISVLNQDDARSFHASDAKKKYSLFRKATNLDQTEINYVRAIENCNKAKVIWDRKQAACVELEKEYKKWKTSYNQLQSRNEMEAQKHALQNEYYWSEIAELEQDVNTIQTQYDKQKARIDKLVEKLQQMEETYGNDNDAIGGLKNKLEEMNLQKTALEQQLRDLEEDVRREQQSLRTAAHATGKQRDILAREEKKVEDIEREIQSIESGSASSRQQELERQSAAAAAAAAAARARLDTAAGDADQARHNAGRAAAAADAALHAARAKTDRLRQLKQQVRELESRGADSLAVYGAAAAELAAQLRNNHKLFSAPPKGPVGSFLKVKEKKWAGVLEHIIGGSVQSFCVNSPEDSRKLFEIMNKVYGSSPKPAVTCSKFLPQRHDVRRSSVHVAGFTSALDALQVDDPVIANYLIDNLGLENILLVPDHEDATRLSDTVENVPEHCARIVTLDCTEYFPAPTYRCYGGAARTPRFLQCSTADRKRQVQAEIKETESQLHKLQAEAENLSEQAKQASEAERAAARRVQALMGETHKTAAAARAAESALQQHHAPHHDLLVDELNISKEKVSTISSQLQVLSSKEQEHRQKIDELDARMNKAKGKLGKLTNECRTLAEQIEQDQLSRDRGASERHTCAQRVREDRIKLAQVEALLQQKREVIASKIQEAETLCPRIDNPREKTLVASELKKTTLKLSSYRRDGLSRADVAERLLAAEGHYRRSTAALASLSGLIEQIKSTTDKHLSFCHRVQTYIARRVQHCFQSILTIRGYSGRMEIDNARGTLDIQCSGRESGARRVAATTSSLSGGERSYSTVAFIMALWDCVELPFYFMDEFDVFMDNVNRKIVMELLIDYALKNTSRQFVFLTPQDASAVVATEKIAIHMMADPRP